MKKFIITEGERKRILNLHKSRTSNQYLMEQTNNVSLPNGAYLADGSSNRYDIKDLSGNKTGYSVLANMAIRCCGEDSPMVVIDGVPISKIWGQGGEISFNDVGWSGNAGAIPKITPESLANNSIPKEVIDARAPYVKVVGGKCGFWFGENEDKYYELDVSSVLNIDITSELGTESIDSLIEYFNKYQTKYPEAYNYLSNNAKLGTQYIMLWPHTIFVNKGGNPEVFTVK